MVSIFKLFLINEVGPIQPTWTKNSITSTAGDAVQSGKPEPVGVKVAKMQANKDNIVKSLPKSQLGMKPFPKRA